ncbi:MAG: hypothetical protein ACRDD7_17325 [Peptostreptococcaceae bacterium]
MKETHRCDSCDEKVNSKEELILDKYGLYNCKLCNDIKYKGNRCNCKECEYCPKPYIEDNKMKYTACKNLDHSNLRFYPHIFNGYDGALRARNICDKFVPAKWNISGQNEWLGIEEYYKFMNQIYYSTPSFVDYNKIKDTTTGGVTICVGGFDVYGEYQYNVTLHDWMTGEWLKDNKIKYLLKREVIRTPQGKPKKSVVVDRNGIEDISKYLIYKISKI